MKSKLRYLKAFWNDHWRITKYPEAKIVGGIILAVALSVFMQIYTVMRVDADKEVDNLAKSLHQTSLQALEHARTAKTLKSKLKEETKAKEALQKRYEILEQSKARGNVVHASPQLPAPAGSHQDWLKAAGVPSAVWGCAEALVQRESGWNPRASNPSSGAYGLPQALPGSKMASHGSDWQTNPITQLKWMSSYVAERYGGWCEANNFQLANNWY